MAHRHVYVYSLPELSASGDNCKPQSSRESALKFLTRSVACMADGKGMSIFMSSDSGREYRADNQDGHLDQSKVG